MKNTKEDKRIIKTKTTLANSLIDLLEEKELSQITIKQLVDHAQINRSTFYLHYPDIRSLLSELEDDLTSQIASCIKRTTTVVTFEESKDIMISLFTFIRDNYKLCKVLLYNRSNSQIWNKISSYVKEDIEHKMLTKTLKPLNESDWFLAYHRNGCIGIIKEWVSTGMPIPIEAIAEEFCNIVCIPFCALNKE